MANIDFDCRKIAEVLANVLGHENGPMTPANTEESDGQRTALNNSFAYTLTNVAVSPLDSSGRRGFLYGFRDSGIPPIKMEQGVWWILQAPTVDVEVGCGAWLLKVLGTERVEKDLTHGDLFQQARVAVERRTVAETTSKHKRYFEAFNNNQVSYFSLQTPNRNSCLCLRRPTQPPEEGGLSAAASAASTSGAIGGSFFALAARLKSRMSFRKWA